MTKLVVKFLMRNNLKYEILIILFIGVYSSIQNSRSRSGLTLSITMLSILFLVYFHVLIRQKSRITLLYSGLTIKKMKIDLIKTIAVLSLFFLIISLLTDVFIWQEIDLIIYYFLSMVIFIFSAIIVPINIERREQHNPNIVTIQDGMKIIGITLLLLIVSQLLIQLVQSKK